jgi:hypothetical protein
MKKIFIVIGILFIALIGFLLADNLLTSGKAIENQEKIDSDSEVTLKVSIPCEGHASLIIGYLKQAGVSEVNFRTPNYFDVRYDSSKITKEKILNIDIFKEYPAEEA